MSYLRPDFSDQAATLDYFKATAPGERETPLIVNFGAGVDSTAMLIRFVDEGIVPDLILFADTGAEKPETLEHAERFSAWLVERGFPAVKTVSRSSEIAGRASTPYDSIEGNVVANMTVPSLAYGHKSCSLKWKAEPMDAFLKGRPRAGRAPWAPAAEAWGRNLKPVKAIGYDCSPADSRRAVGRTEDEDFVYLYPLRVWGWKREDCLEVCEVLGWQVEKSACYFCPASTSCELRRLAERNPDLFRRALAIEKNARDHGAFQTIDGMGRKDDSKRPGNWHAWAIENGLVREDDDFSDVQFSGLKAGVTFEDLEAAWELRKAKREAKAAAS